MALLDDVKVVLRESESYTDSEIQDLINFAKADIKRLGILESKIVDTDPFIIQAIKTYCKAYYGWGNEDFETLKQSYESQVATLSLNSDYITPTA